MNEEGNTRGTKAVSMTKNISKTGSDLSTSEPVFIATPLFDLFSAHLLTLLLIGGQPDLSVSPSFFANSCLLVIDC